MKINYKRAIYDPPGNPLEYPSKIIKRPILISDGASLGINPSSDFKSFSLADGRDVDQYLSDKASAVISERVAQIAFGANRNTENIAWKFRNYKLQNKDVSQDLIAIPGFLNGADVVACNIGYWGYVYA